jgi:hypothetical protein
MNVHTNALVSNFIKIRASVLELSQYGRQTDRHKEASRRIHVTFSCEWA